MVIFCRYLYFFFWISFRGGCVYGVVAWFVRDVGGRFSFLFGYFGSFLFSRLARGLLTYGDVCLV